MGLLYYISIARLEMMKDYELEVVVHVANGEAFLEGGHIFNQLGMLMKDIMHVGERKVQFRLFESHNLAASYANVTWD